MKKLLIFIVYLFLLSSIFALNSSVTLGYQDKYIGGFEHEPIYIEIDLWQDIGNLRIYGKYTNEMSKSDYSWMFSPAQDYYTVGAEYNFDIFVLRAEHMCMHPVVSDYSWDGLQGGYTKIEIQLGD